MKKLKEKWRFFLGIILGPGSVIFVLLTIFSLFLSVYFLNNKELSILLSVIGSIFGGIAGSFIKDDYNKLVGENILEKKGLSAIRNLKSIEKQLVNIRSWMKSFIKGKISKKQAIEEIERHLSTTQFNIYSGFKDWEDMVPELVQEAERVAEITKKQQEVFQTYIKEILNKKKELITSKDQKRVEELKKRISILEGQIKDIKLSNIYSIRQSTPLSNTPLELRSPEFGIADFVSSGNYNQKCLNCGKSLEKQNFGALGISSIYDSYCDKCKNEKLIGL